MKKQIFILGALAIFNTSVAQELPQSSIPSVIVNQFNRHFPKATDVDWEMQGTLYNVEFETGWNTDHEVWYNAKGEVVKHKEDIAENKLPKVLKTSIQTHFKGYTIDDLERISEQGKVVYKMELNSILQQDWDVVMDVKGIILSKIAD